MKRISLKIALPSKDMQQPTEDLLRAARMNIVRHSGRNTHFLLEGFEGIREGSFMRSSDVAEFVASGDYDLGITTTEVIAEGRRKVETCELLGYSRNGGGAKIAVFTHRSSGIRTLKDIPRGTKIRTELLRVTRAYFKQLGLEKHVVLVPSRGSTETHVPRSYPVGVCLVDSGQTLRDHGHRIIADMPVGVTVLIANPRALKDSRKREVIEDFRTLLAGAVNARRLRTILMDAPKEALSKIREILPYREGQSPTISPLDDDTKVAIEYVVPADQINALVPKLKRAGATYILVRKEESVIP